MDSRRKKTGKTGYDQAGPVGFILLLILAGGWFSGCTPVVREYRDLKSKDYREFPGGETQPVYRGDSLENIRFPVGGMETGYLWLGGRAQPGELVRGKPEINLSRSVFALWEKESGEFNAVREREFEPQVRILEGRISPEDRESQVLNLPGIPRMEACSFQAEFPFGRWTLSDPEFPLLVELEAFNPFIPWDERSSSLPAAILHWKISNPLDKPVKVSLAFRIRDPFPQGDRNVAAARKPFRVEGVNAGDFKGLLIRPSEEKKSSGRKPGLLLISLPGSRIETGSYSLRPEEDEYGFWQDFSRDGIPDLAGKGGPDGGPGTDPVSGGNVGTPPEEVRTVSLWTGKTLEAGETWNVPFLLSWDRDPLQTLSWIIGNREYLYRAGRDFSTALFGCSYPGYVTEAMAAGLAAALEDPPCSYPGVLAWLFQGRREGENILALYHAWRFNGEDAAALSALNLEPEKVRPDLSPAEISLGLAERRALSQMANALGLEEPRERYQRESDRLADLLDQGCWNGEYYYSAPREACRADQLLGQYLAFSLGMDTLVPLSRLKKALQSLYRYNYLPQAGERIRIGSQILADQEGGLLACTWPYGREPFPRPAGSDDVPRDLEYATAAAMIRCGMVEEALGMIKTARERRRGFNRNPWTAGGDRQLASAWDIHLALSGYRYLQSGNVMEFDPKINRNDFSSLWTAPAAWGTVRLSRKEMDLRVKGGRLEIGEIRVPSDYRYSLPETEFEEKVTAVREGNTIRLILSGISVLGPEEHLKIVFR